MNAALAIAQGAWIAPCDDDDEITDESKGSGEGRRLGGIMRQSVASLGYGCHIETR